MSVKGQMSGISTQCHQWTYCDTKMRNNFSRNATSTDTAIKKKKKREKKQKKKCKYHFAKLWSWSCCFSM